MNKATLICLIILSVGSSLGAQTMDSILRLLPSRAEYFSPQSYEGEIAHEDHSREALLQYMGEGLMPQREGFARLGTRLIMPRVLRPMERVEPLGFSAPSLSLSPTKAEPFPSIGRWLGQYRRAAQLEQSTLNYLTGRQLDRIDYSAAQLAEVSERLRTKGNELSTDVLGAKLSTRNIKQYDGQITGNEIERRYWIPSFESSIQFSQNYISDNWYKGGNSNLNLSMRNYVALLYSRGKHQWLNELESKLGIYTSTESGTSSKYRISEDLLRLHSNYGIKMSKHWSYTLDGELRTQLFKTYNPTRTLLQSAPWAPIRTNIGLGLKYSYSTRSKERYGRKFSASLNFAPFSHNWRWSSRGDIDLARHGLKPDERSIHTFGSTLRGQMQWDFNMDVSWTSRVYFNTSYKAVEAEWENTLTMRISRYFSTRINLQLRYDDSAKPSDKWNRYLQINEMLSFGFNYKL